MPMTPRASEIYQLIDQIAPFDTAEDFDNAGFLIGSQDQRVEAVLCTLDVTKEVVREAEKAGVQLIISHHPLFFKGHKNLLEGDPEVDVICEMVRARLSLISAHTNLDKTFYSGSACAARALGLENIRQEGYLFIGDMPKDAKVNASGLKNIMHEKLRAPLRMYGEETASIRTLAIAGGAYGEGYHEIIEKNLGAQAYLTGEIRHHEALDAVERGLVIYDGGHYATERLLVPELASYLQNALDALKYSVRVYPSTCVSFPGALE